MTELHRIRCVWDGPFTWPGYERQTGLRPIPAQPGVYLWTFSYQGGYLIYAAGLTRTTVPRRFSAHTRLYRRGDDNVLDLDVISQGERRLIWQGWGWDDEKRVVFESRKAELTAAVDRRLREFRVFTADIGTAPRLLERLEAAIMHRLYRERSPFCDIPDKGMHLSRRWPQEVPIVVENQTAVLLHCLPEQFTM